MSKLYILNKNLTVIEVEHCFVRTFLDHHTTLQGKTILVAMVTKILELATKLEPKSPAWRLK